MLLLLRVFHVEQMLCACTLFAVLAVFGAVAPHGAVTPWEFGRGYGGYRAVSVGVAWLARWQFFGGRLAVCGRCICPAFSRRPAPALCACAVCRLSAVPLPASALCACAVSCPSAPPPRSGAFRPRGACPRLRPPTARVGLRPCAVRRPACARCAPAVRCPSRVVLLAVPACASARRAVLRSAPPRAVWGR